MISVYSIVTDALNTVDSVIGNFVSNVYSNFIQANSGTISLLFTVYVMLLGYRLLYHGYLYNMSHVVRHLIIMLCVYGMVMNWDLYNIFVYNIFTNEPGNIASILVNASGHSGSISQALDAIYKSIIDATVGFFGQISFSASGVAFLLYGILVFLIGTFLCVFALLLFIYAKMMMAIVLALGPIFILFFLWEPTKGLFASWLRTLITLALIPIITTAILVLMLSVINVTLPGINQPVSNMQFYGIVPFLVLSLATTLLLSQVFSISSSLGGGITLARMSAGVDMARNALDATGIPSLFRPSSNWQPQKNDKARKNFTRRSR